MNQTLNTAEVEVGIVGLGLMGSSIVASMLASGHKVIALAPVENELKEGLCRIRNSYCIAKNSDSCPNRLKNTLRN